jgi:hypothetical protein
MTKSFFLGSCVGCKVKVVDVLNIIARRRKAMYRGAIVERVSYPRIGHLPLTRLAVQLILRVQQRLCAPDLAHHGRQR